MHNTALRYRDKVAVVTGASSGIGAAVARELAGDGASVVLVARRADALHQRSKDVEAAGGSATVMPCNLTERGDSLAIDRNSFDPVNGHIVNKRLVIRGGRRKRTPFFVRVYCASELRCYLRRAGFAGVRFFGDWEGGPLTLNSWRMIAIARK